MEVRGSPYSTYVDMSICTTWGTKWRLGEPYMINISDANSRAIPVLVCAVLTMARSLPSANIPQEPRDGMRGAGIDARCPSPLCAQNLLLANRIVELAQVPRNFCKRGQCVGS